MKSLWRDSVSLPRFEKLEKNIQTKVLIIGGGMAGLLCAHMLERRGIDYVLLESDRICNGVTANTTAKITAQHGLIYSKIIKEYGVDSARLYYQANVEALNEFSNLCSKIDCEYEEQDSFVYSLDGERKIHNELEAIEKIGGKAQFSKAEKLPFDVDGAVEFKNQAQFNPLKFSAGLAKNLNIYENSRVCELTKHTAVTDNAKVTADKIIVATHFPFINKHGSYYLKMFQHRSYAIAFENAGNVGGMYVDEADNGMSFRNYRNYLFIGGGDHRTGKQGGNWRELENFAAKYFTDAKEKYRWSTQDCITLDGMPYIGNYSKRTPDFYVASGFNKWGMTSSMVSAMLLSDMVIGNENPYEKLFSPSRTILHPQLAVNAFEAITNLLTFSKKRCPHLGCALKWNSDEHSWDCPCHGSRFDESGKLLDNPSTNDIEI